MYTGRLELPTDVRSIEIHFANGSIFKSATTTKELILTDVPERHRFFWPISRREAYNNSIVDCIANIRSKQGQLPNEVTDKMFYDMIYEFKLDKAVPGSEHIREFYQNKMHAHRNYAIRLCNDEMYSTWVNLVLSECNYDPYCV